VSGEKGGFSVGPNCESYQSADELLNHFVTAKQGSNNIEEGTCALGKLTCDQSDAFVSSSETASGRELTQKATDSGRRGHASCSRAGDARSGTVA